MAESNKESAVTVRHPATLEEREVAKAALPYFKNQGFQVLTKDGRVNVRATNTTAAQKEN